METRRERGKSQCGGETRVHARGALQTVLLPRLAFPAESPKFYQEGAGTGCSPRSGTSAGAFGNLAREFPCRTRGWTLKEACGGAGHRGADAGACPGMRGQARAASAGTSGHGNAHLKPGSAGEGLGPPRPVLAPHHQATPPTQKPRPLSRLRARTAEPRPRPHPQGHAPNLPPSPRPHPSAPLGSFRRASALLGCAPAPRSVRASRRGSRRRLWFCPVPRLTTAARVRPRGAL